MLKAESHLTTPAAHSECFVAATLTVLKRDGGIFPVNFDENALPSDVFPRDEAYSASNEATRHTALAKTR